MKAFELLKSLRDRAHVCPRSRERGKTGSPSNSEIRRWLEKGSVLINGKRPEPNDLVAFPISQLVFFPGAVSQTTIVWGSLMRFDWEFFKEEAERRHLLYHSWLHKYVYDCNTLSCKMLEFLRKER